ncbi:MAG: choice-of-anchor J domain-containing protein [Armatimonadetes bacterium]|nr:choice-of-anchor J domain-containing protein [Armatimonadota bacterium]
MKPSPVLHSALLLLAASSAANAAVVWTQGLDGVFESQAGVPDAYVGVGSDSTGGDESETISNWLLTPPLDLAGSPTLSFWTRTVDTPAFPDRLEVRVSTNGDSANVGTGAESVGDFGAVLLSVNPALEVSGYPNGWTRYEAVLPAFAPLTTGRNAYRYFVTDAGRIAANGDYIGVDTVRVAETVAVPESPALPLLAFALPLLALRRNRSLMPV